MPPPEHSHHLDHSQLDALDNNLSIPGGLSLTFLDWAVLPACYGKDYSILTAVVRKEKEAGKQLLTSFFFFAYLLFVRAKDLHSTIRFFTTATRDQVVARRHLML
jgi:hypothetical protein